MVTKLTPTSRRRAQSVDGSAGIPMHRSISSLRLPWHRIGLGVAIAMLFSLVLIGLHPAIEATWGAQMVWWMRALEMPGQFEPALTADHELFLLAAPLIEPQLPENAWPVLARHALATLAVWVGSGWLPESARPATYLLRFAALIHGVSIVYFLGWPGSFAHTATGHVANGLSQGWALMLLTPWLHLVTYYIFPFAWWQRVALTALTLIFLFVATPLQYASHAALLSLLGLVMLPLLHLLFGVMVPIIGLVALYGWGMSWHDPRQPHASSAPFTTPLNPKENP